MPVACEVTVAPTTGDIVCPDGDTFVFTIITKSADGRVQTVSDDVFTVTLTAISDEEQAKKDAGESFNEVVVSDTASYVFAGQYAANLLITQEGSYNVLITMENANTMQNPDISTICSANTSLDITDVTTVPSQSSFMVSPMGDVDVGTTVTFDFQSNSADGSPQDVATDVYTVTLTCNNDICNDQVYTETAADMGTGSY